MTQWVFYCTEIWNWDAKHHLSSPCFKAMSPHWESRALHKLGRGLAGRSQWWMRWFRFFFILLCCHSAFPPQHSGVSYHISSGNESANADELQSEVCCMKSPGKDKQQSVAFLHVERNMFRLMHLAYIYTVSTSSSCVH